MTIRILAYNHQVDCQAEVRYATDALLERIGFRASWSNSLEELRANDADDAALILTYGLEEDVEHLPGPTINIRPCHFFARMYESGKLDEKDFGTSLPVIEPITWQQKPTNRLVVEQDVIASAFFCLSRYEEVYASEETLDRFGRFPASASRAVKQNVLDRPLVDEYAQLLRQAILALVGDERLLPPLPTWSGRSFSVAVTHDIDTIRKYHPGKSRLRQLASKGIRYGQWKEVAQTIGENAAVRLGGRSDPYEFEIFRRLNAIEERYNCRASYYFLVGGSTFAERVRMDLSTPAARRVLKYLEQEGHELGFHPSFATSVDEAQFSEQLDSLRTALGTPILGGRQHYLRFSTPDTWRLWENNGLRYDSTLGFADRAGFRCGTCFPFRPFDLRARRVLDLWEIPLIVMDRTLYDHHYQRMGSEDALRSICHLMDRVRAVGGIFVLLWHPPFIDTIGSPGWATTFSQTLAYATEHQASIGPLRDALQAWEAYQSRPWNVGSGSWATVP